MKNEFYPRLESLRGIAALLVALFHCAQSQWLDATGNLQQFNLPQGKIGWQHDLSAGILRGLGNGVGAVVLFFVISGFVLSGSLSRDLALPVARRALKFLIARVLRIYPASMITILAFVIVFLTTGAYLTSPEHYRPVFVLKNILLLDATINGVMWTLQVELLAIPLIFLVFVGAKHWGAIIPISTICVLIPLSFTSNWNQAFGFVNLGLVYAFIPGIMAFIGGREIIERWGRRFSSVLLAITVGGFLAIRPLIGFFSTWSAIGEAILGGLIVSFLAFGRLGSVGRIFDARIIRFFGQISYSFYLLHPLTLIIIWKSPEWLGFLVTGWGVPKLVVGLGLFFVSTAVVTPLAWAMYQYVERPGVAAGRRLFKIENRLS